MANALSFQFILDIQNTILLVAILYVILLGIYYYKNGEVPHEVLTVSLAQVGAIIGGLRGVVLLYTSTWVPKHPQVAIYATLGSVLLGVLGIKNYSDYYRR